MIIKEAKWDSDFLGIKVGVCELQDRDEWDHHSLEKWDLVYISVDPETAAKTPQLKNSKIQFVDEKVTYVFSLTDFDAGKAQNVCMPYHSSEEDERIIGIGLQSSQYSRFGVDRRFGRENCIKLYRIWMEKSISREMATEVLVSRNENDHSVNGLVTLKDKNDLSVIGIFAVDEKCRGKGIGQKLLEAAKCYSKGKGSKELHVTTQGSNELACRFYDRNGFIKRTTRNIYHYWK